MTQQNALELFKDSNALLTGHFRLTSGRHSDVYYEKFALLRQPVVCTRLCHQMADQLSGLQIETVVGPTTGGIIIAYDVARYLGVDAIYAEPEGDGRAFKRGLSLRPGQRVGIVDDVLTTGKSIREVIDLVKSYDATIVKIVEMIDRSNGMVQFDYPFSSLATVKAESWLPQECPLCRQGQPLTQRGSRVFRQS